LAGGGVVGPAPLYAGVGEAPHGRLRVGVVHRAQRSVDQGFQRIRFAVLRLILGHVRSFRPCAYAAAGSSAARSSWSCVIVATPANVACAPQYLFTLRSMARSTLCGSSPAPVIT